MVAGEARGSANLGRRLPAGLGAVLVNVFVVSSRVATRDYERLRWRCRRPQPRLPRRKTSKVGSWRAAVSPTRVKRPVLWRWPRRPSLPKEVLSVLHSSRAAGVFFISHLGFNESGGPCHQGGMLGLWRVAERTPLLPGRVRTVACRFPWSSGHLKPWGTGTSQILVGGRGLSMGRGKGRAAGSVALGDPGIRSAGTFERCPENFLPRTILESNCLLMPSGCN